MTRFWPQRLIIVAAFFVGAQMKNNNDYLAKNQLSLGHAYIVDARNFRVGLWDGKVFHGLRYKFGSWFPDLEYHYDDGPPYGTVKPISLIPLG